MCTPVIPNRICGLVLLVFLAVFAFFVDTPRTAASTLQMETPLSNAHGSRFLENRYLREARVYRSEGRYELARQSYALALSICSSTRKLAIIREELDGLELMLRTLR